MSAGFVLDVKSFNLDVRSAHCSHCRFLKGFLQHGLKMHYIYCIISLTVHLLIVFLIHRFIFCSLKYKKNSQKHQIWLQIACFVPKLNDIHFNIEKYKPSHREAVTVISAWQMSSISHILIHTYYVEWNAKVKLYSLTFNQKSPVGRSCLSVVEASAGCVSVFSRRSRLITAAVCTVQLWPVSSFSSPTHISKTCPNTDS